jgi:hypothetical protein
MFEIDPHRVNEQKEIGKSGVEKLFVQTVSRNGGRAIKFTAPGTRGVSDRVVLFPNQVWFVELKRASGKLTPLQRIFKDYITELGLNHYVVYGAEGIKKFMEKVNDKSREA